MYPNVVNIAVAPTLTFGEFPMKLPSRRFYLFGMGRRRKLLYKAGCLNEVFTGDVLRAWDVAEERIEPSEYRVSLRTRYGDDILLFEDETGVWVEENGNRQLLTGSPVRLPRFDGHAKSGLLRTLHQEILINIVDGKPVPNLLVYRKPWYRDAAMMMFCLRETGNLGLVEEWVGGLRDPFDRNNAGHEEPDNLGQLLTMIAMVGDAQHPLVSEILRTARRFTRDRHLMGSTDMGEHPVYQTKWMKYGLRALGLDDPYIVPRVADSYSSLFWMDFTDAHVPCPRFGMRAVENYPYLGWAEAHFYGSEPPMCPEPDTYPLTWEAYASQANYAEMGLISPEYVERKIAAPHTWHAAEMFSYFMAHG